MQLMSVRMKRFVCWLGGRAHLQVCWQQSAQPMVRWYQLVQPVIGMPRCAQVAGRTQRPLLGHTGAPAAGLTKAQDGMQQKGRSLRPKAHQNGAASAVGAIVQYRTAQHAQPLTRISESVPFF